MIYLTSDCHFGHKRILEYEKDTRPFETVEEHDEALIRNWNSVVDEDDIVYVVGDFIMGSADNVHRIVPQLNGFIVLVRGNHDTNSKVDIYKEYGIGVVNYRVLRHRGVWFILAHYPIDGIEDAHEELEAEKAVLQYELIPDPKVYCYGHVHHNAPVGYVNGIYHVGVDTNNLTPISIEKIYSEVIDDIKIWLC